MKMKFNKYFRPTSVQEAIELLQNNEDSKIVAGGTDVVIRLRAHMLKVDTLVDISVFDRAARRHGGAGRERRRASRWADVLHAWPAARAGHRRMR